jgi:hypothetical protein
MQALRDPANGWVIPGTPTRSPIVRSFFDYNHPMGRALSGLVPEAGGTGRDVVWRWIKAGCPIPGERPAPAVKLEAFELPDATRIAAAVSASALPSRPQLPAETAPPVSEPRLRFGMGGYVH